MMSIGGIAKKIRQTLPTLHNYHASFAHAHPLDLHSQGRTTLPLASCLKLRLSRKPLPKHERFQSVSLFCTDGAVPG